jgi:hypothetical protein
MRGWSSKSDSRLLLPTALNSEMGGQEQENNILCKSSMLDKAICQQ